MFCKAYSKLSLAKHEKLEHVEHYLIPVGEQTYERLFADRQLYGLCRSTNCSLKLLNRRLYRSYGDGIAWLGYFIVRVEGSNEASVRRFNTLLGAIYPEYKLRKVYTEGVSTSRLKTNGFHPQNLQLTGQQATGATGPTMGRIPLISPYANSEKRPPHSTPWKLTFDEKLGLYTPDTFIAKAKTFSGIEANVHALDYKPPYDHTQLRHLHRTAVNTHFLRDCREESVFHDEVELDAWDTEEPVEIIARRSLFARQNDSPLALSPFPEKTNPKLLRKKAEKKKQRKRDKGKKKSRTPKK
jgi:hypothetical protein